MTWFYLFVTPQRATTFGDWWISKRTHKDPSFWISTHKPQGTIGFSSFNKLEYATGCLTAFSSLLDDKKLLVSEKRGTNNSDVRKVERIQLLLTVIIRPELQHYKKRRKKTPNWISRLTNEKFVQNSRNKIITTNIFYGRLGFFLVLPEIQRLTTQRSTKSNCNWTKLLRKVFPRQSQKPWVEKS